MPSSMKNAMKMMATTTNWGNRAIKGPNLPTQAEARRVLALFEAELKPASSAQIRAMLEKWNEKGLLIDKKTNFPVYVVACCKAWSDLPAAFIEWASDNWELQSKFYPKYAEFLEFSKPYTTLWDVTRGNLFKLANWEREVTFVKQGTVESRRKVIEESRKYRDQIKDEGRGNE